MLHTRSRLWLILSILLSVSLACSIGLPDLPSPFTPPTPTPNPQPPAIIETVPPAGSQIPLQSTIFIYFNQPMDRASVEAAISLSPNVQGLWNWMDDTILTFTPAQPLASDSTLAISLGMGAKAANGLTLLAEQRFDFATAGPLRVTQTLPEGGALDVSPASAIVVSFNQPVVALGADASGQPAAFSLEPAAGGRGEWLNTSTYIFYPEPGLTGGADYVVRLNNQLVSAGGSRLADDSVAPWGFRTALPRVVNYQPDPELALGLDTPITIQFNQPMDTSSVESAFQMSGPGGRADGKFEWNKNQTELTFTPSGLYQRGTVYSFSLNASARSRGGASLVEGIQRDYYTYADMALLYTVPSAGATLGTYASIQAVFAAPVQSYTDAELQKLVTVSPEASAGFYPDGQTLNIYGSFEADQTYQVTVSPEIEDIWGQKLGQTLSFSVRTAPARPQAKLPGYSELFLRPDDLSVPVQAAGLTSLDVSFAPLSMADYLKFSGGSGFSALQSFSPQGGTRLTQPLDYSSRVVPVKLNLSQGGSDAPGLYFVQINNTNLDDASYYAHSRVVLVSNINVTVKYNAGEARLWAVDWRTGQPVANRPVVLYGSEGSVLASGATDASGMWQATYAAQENVYYGPVAIIGQPGDDFFGIGAGSWSYGLSSYDFGILMGGESPRNDAYIYTDRPIYRAGQQVFFRGVLRQGFNARYSALDVRSVRAAVELYSGEVLAEQTFSVSEFGTFNGQLTLPAGMIPGSYSLRVYPDTDVKLVIDSAYFTVADYRKPELNLSVEFPQSDVRQGQEISATAHVDYFFGAPAAEANVTWYAYSSSTWFDLPGYQVGTYTTDWIYRDYNSLGSISDNGDGVTLEDGTLPVALGNLAAENTQTVTLEITATESNGYPVSTRESITVHPSDYYIGVRPAQWVGRANSPLGFDLLTADWDKKPVGGKNLQVKFQKVTWDSTGSGYALRAIPVYEVQETRQVSVSGDGTATLSFTPSQAGTYMLDVSGDGAHTQAMVWVGGGQQAIWPTMRFDQVEITADRSDYKPGDTASIFVPNPFDVPAQAWVTLERSKIISSQVVTIPAGGGSVSIAVTQDMAPNVYASVTLLGPDSRFRQGYARLKVDPSAFVLNVEMKTTPEKAAPGQPLTIDLRVTDASGQPVQGEFSVGVVDLAVLALADRNSEEIIPFYYRAQPLGVHTGLTAAIYAGRFLPDFGGMGGGGGGEDTVLRENFPDTAFWKADIVTDAQGRAQVTFNLPDNLTTWQVDARGLTADTRVGQAMARVVTTKDLLIRPATPRFFVLGDHVQLAAMVNNNTTGDLSATIGLQASGFALDDEKTSSQKVTIPANGRTRVVWWGTVQDADDASLVFSVKAGNLQDASTPAEGDIPILRYRSPQTFATAGILPEAGSRLELVSLPRSFVPQGGDLTLELSPSLGSTLLSALDALDVPELDTASPETLLSYYLANIDTYETLKTAGLSDPALEQRLRNSLSSTAERLYTLRAPDGGWGWANAQESDPYITAYILFGLLRARQLQENFTIPDYIISESRDFLFGSMPLLTADPASITDADLNSAAFYLYVLQQIDDPNLPPLLNNLYDARERLDPWAKALLAACLDADGQAQRADELFSALQTDAIRSATGAHWQSDSKDWRNPSTPLYTTGVVTYLLAGRDPANPLLADAVRYLASQRNARGWWGSTYETAWVTMALNAVMKGTGELQADYAYSAMLNGKSLVEGQAAQPQTLTTVRGITAITDLYASAPNGLLLSRQAGVGRLYYRAILNVFRPVESAPALDQGIAVSRQYFDCSTDCQPITDWKLSSDPGARFKASITVTIPADVYYFNVEDFIPAGAEILNATLKTSQLGQESTSVSVYDPENPYADGWGWWYFGSPRITRERILWSADYLPAGTYVLSYTLIPSTAGEFRVLPAHAWLEFFPEVQGTSAGSVFNILP